MLSNTLVHHEKIVVSERMKRRAGTVVAAVLAVDGLIHAYWTTGAIWPAHDASSLSRAVLNTEISFKPTVVGPLACLLLLGSLTAMARVHRLGEIGRRVPDRAAQGGMLLIAAGLLARGAAGIGMAVLGEPGTTFHRLNIVLYTPACLALFVAALAASRAERQPSRRSS